MPDIPDKRLTHLLEHFTKWDDLLGAVSLSTPHTDIIVTANCFNLTLVSIIDEEEKHGSTHVHCVLGPEFSAQGQLE